MFTASLSRNLDRKDEVYISRETREWLLEDNEIAHALQEQERLEVRSTTSSGS